MRTEKSILTYCVTVVCGLMLLVGTTKISGKEYDKYLMNITQADEQNTVTDIDGNIYKVVQIGAQWWMAENLRTTRYANGDPIPLISNNLEWSKLTTGAWCWYDNNSEHDEVYGKLYNWHTISDERGICPEGWRVPSDEEWYFMENFIDPSINDPDQVNWRGTDAGTKLKAVGELFSGAGAGRGVRKRLNEYDFSAYLGGYRHIYGLFLNFEGSGIWWTSTEYADHYALYRMMYFDLPNIRRLVDSKRYGFSIRCIKE